MCVHVSVNFVLYLIYCPTVPSAAAGTVRPSRSVAGKLVIHVQSSS